jgi:hypothetical protein
VFVLFARLRARRAPVTAPRGPGEYQPVSAMTASSEAK